MVQLWDEVVHDQVLVHAAARVAAGSGSLSLRDNHFGSRKGSLSSRPKQGAARRPAGEQFHPAQTGSNPVGSTAKESSA